MIIKGNSAQTNNYFILSNSVVQNKDLSWKEKGLLGYLLSLGESWNIKQENLFKYSDHDGRESTQNALKKLQQKGYLKIVKLRDTKTGHFCGYEYHVFQIPEDKNTGQQESRISVNQPSGKPDIPPINNNNKIPIEKIPIEKIPKTNVGFEQLALFPDIEVDNQPAKSKDQEADEIFDYYCQVFTGLYRPRKSRVYTDKIKMRLKNFTPEELKEAVTKLRHDGWSIGNHPDNKKFYATIEFLFRSDSQIDKYLNFKVEIDYNLMSREEFIKALKQDFEDYDYGAACSQLLNRGHQQDNNSIYAYHEKYYKKNSARIT